MKQQRPSWIRVPESKIKEIAIPFAEKIDEMWVWNKVPYSLPIQIHHLGKRKLGNTTHLTVKKVNMAKVAQSKMAYFYSDEPTYEEKVKIFSHISEANLAVALEVFPSQRNVIDQANLYHIWVVEKSSFPFSIKETTEIPENKKWIKEKFGNLEIEYIIRVIGTEFGKAAYIYLRRCDGKELCWSEKQMLKNEIQFDDIVAIELISKYGIGKATCLLALPLGYTLDFGLHLD